MRRRVISLIIAFVLVISLLPVVSVSSVAQANAKIAYITKSTSNNSLDFENFFQNEGYLMDVFISSEYKENTGWNNESLESYKMIIVDRNIIVNSHFNGYYNDLVTYLRATDKTVVTALPELLVDLGMAYGAMGYVTKNHTLPNMKYSKQVDDTFLFDDIDFTGINANMYAEVVGKTTIASVTEESLIMKMHRVEGNYRDAYRNVMNATVALYEKNQQLADGSLAKGVRIFVPLNHSKFTQKYSTNGVTLYKNIFGKYVSSFNVLIESQAHGSIIGETSYTFDQATSLSTDVAVDTNYTLLRWEKRVGGNVEVLSNDAPITINVDTDTTITAIIGLENVPTITSYKVLEVQPYYDASNLSNTHELDVSMISDAFSKYGLSPSISLDQVSIEGFISNVEQLNGKYDLIYVGNKFYYDNTDPRYSFVGATNSKSNNPITYFAQDDTHEHSPGLPNKAPFNSLKDNNSNEYYSAKDITNKRASELNNYLEAGYPLLMNEAIFTNDYQTTKLYTLYKQRTESNLVRSSDISNDVTTIIENVITGIYPFSDQLLLNEVPLPYIDENGQAQYQEIVGQKNLVYNLTLNSSNEDAKDVHLYLDINGDGLFKEDERFTSEHLTSPESMTLTYKLPSKFVGFLPWKLEVENLVTKARVYEIGHTAFVATEEGETFPDVNVLQLFPERKANLLDLRTLGSLLSQDNLYNINIQTMGMDAFNQRFIDGDPVILNGVYDMIIIGFADSVSEGGVIDHPEALLAIEAFVESGQSVMLTHDMFHFYTGRAEETGYYAFGKYFRDSFGQNIYAYDTVKYDSEVNAILADEYNEMKTRVPDGANRLAGFSDGILTRANNNQMYTTTKAFKANEGQVTLFPYVQPTVLNVANTHSQYYQLDMEDPDLVTWYNLYDNKNDHMDGQNYYYIYSLGNVTYSGTGHSTPSGIEEQKLFINTMIKASASANHAPELTLYDIYEGKEYFKSDNIITFGVQANDIDLTDEHLDLKVYMKAKGSSEYQLVDHHSITNKSFESNQYTEINLAKDADFNSNINNFSIKVIATDIKGASSEITVENLLNSGDVGLDLQSTWSKSALVLGENNSLNISISPRESLTNDTADFSNIQLKVSVKTDDLSIFDADQSFASPMWTAYTVGDETEFIANLGSITHNGTNYQWSQDPTKESIELDTSFIFSGVKMSGVLFDTEIFYDKELQSGAVKRDHIMDLDNLVKIMPGVINVSVLDKKGRPIADTLVTINGPTNTWSGQTSNSGVITFSDLNEGKGPYELVVTKPSGDYTGIQINDGPEFITTARHTFNLDAVNYNQDGNVKVLYESIDNVMFEGQVEVLTLDNIVQNTVNENLSLQFDVGRNANELVIRLSDTTDNELNMQYQTPVSIAPSNALLSVDASGKVITMRSNNGVLEPGRYHITLPVTISAGVPFNMSSYEIMVNSIEIEETAIAGEDPIRETYALNENVGIVAVELGDPPPNPGQQKFSLTFDESATGVIEKQGHGVVNLVISPAENIDLSNLSIDLEVANPNVSIELVEIIDNDSLEITMTNKGLSIAEVQSKGKNDKTYVVRVKIEVVGATLGEGIVLKFDRISGVTITAEMAIPEKNIDVIEALKLD